MTTDLSLSGPTVTLFGGLDLLGTALSDELGRRGCSIHAVTIATGWLDSATHAIVRMDSVSGEKALQDLVSRDAPAAHIVAVCSTTADATTSSRLDDLVRQCGDHHDISVIWHPPVELQLDEDPAADVLAPGVLAAAIVDEIGHQGTGTSTPSFSSRTFERGIWETRGI